VIFDGQERVIAHVDFPRAHCGGKYGVDVAALDEVVAPLWRLTMQWRSIWSTR
jgi:nucleoside-triphosphatase THEP1